MIKRIVDSVEYDIAISGLGYPMSHRRFAQEILKEKASKTKKLTEILNLNMSRTRTTNSTDDSTDENLQSFLLDSTERNSVSSISISDDDGQEIQDEQCSEVDEEEKCEIISKEEVGSDVPGESCSEVETDQEWETFEEVQ